jgi:GAF domain-containing protein
MTDKDLQHQLEGLFSGLVLEPEAEEVELLEEAVADLLGGEARAEPMLIGPAVEKVPPPIPSRLGETREARDLAQISPASVRFWEVTLGRQRTKVLGILLRGATILGIALLILLLVGLVWQKSLIWSGFHTLYFAAYTVAIVITFVQWMFNSTLARDLREAEERHAEAVRSQTLVEERADELATANAQLQKRTLQLQTAVLISQAAASVLEPDELVQQTVSLIRERFNLYYVSLFLVDQSGQWAALQAGTGEAGRQMLAQGYRLEVGDTSTVGRCIANTQAFIAPDLGAASRDSLAEVNPLLPETRSEMALPLRPRGQVIGALDVHSTEHEAFSQEDVAVLQAVANQVAVAIDNAHLFAEMRASLEEMEARQSHRVREQWANFLSTRAIPSYEHAQLGVMPLDDTIASEEASELGRAVAQAMAQREAVVHSDTGDGAGQTALVVPISLRDEVLGALGLHEVEGGRRWTDDEIALIETVADQMALAIENARLLEETRRRADYERLTTDISARVRASTEVDTILRTAIRELGRALRASDGWIQLGSGDQADSPQLGNGVVDDDSADV